MALEMKTKCEKCAATVAASERAFICSYECTFCPACAGEFRLICPNCAGELLLRPRREPKK